MTNCALRPRAIHWPSGRKLEALHAQILGWFEEPLWHNKIGFLVTCGLSLQAIFDLAQGQGKKAFDYALTSRIKATLNTRAGDLDDTLRYENSSHKVTLQRLLLLFNIEVRRDRFPFKEHVGAKWSLEHIHAQKRPGLDPRRAVGDLAQGAPPGLPQRIRTTSNSAAIDPLLAEIHAATPHLHTRQFGLEEFKALAGRVLVVLNGGVEEEADHSIANLALLSLGANAALSNAVFEVKRSKDWR